MTENVYQDIDFYGNSNADGSPVEYFNQNALRNAFLTFLLSKKGEFLKQPEYGGILDFSLFKTLSEFNKDKLIFNIQNAVERYFFPSIKLIEIKVIPNYEKKYWEISITFSESIFDTNQTLIFYTKATINTNPSYTYQEILLEGDNLVKFASNKKANMKGKLLLYEPEFGCFEWGQYKLTNLTPSSPNLSELLSLINLTP